MPTWPASLPQKLELQNYSEKLPETTLRTEMDQGPAKTRRRFTAGVREITGQITLDASQITTFEDFYENDIAGGALKFDMPHPRTGSTVQMRFRGVPQYAALSPELTRVQMPLEVMP